ncbi:MAG: DUF4870 domain-containing protein [Bacteroidetes bacterium]|nr:DUF4870 domain-containing protein [Bacteroidota bacterium]
MDYYPLPQPDEVPVREREDAMGAYLMMFAAVGAGLPLPIISLIASIIYYFINRTKSKFVHFHALQSLLSQLPVSLMNAMAVFWAIRILFFDWVFDEVYKAYLWMLLVVNLAYIIFSLVAAAKARKGQFYYFLFFGRICYQSVFAVKEVAAPAPSNRPPGM